MVASLQTAAGVAVTDEINGKGFTTTDTVGANEQVPLVVNVYTYVPAAVGVTVAVSPDTAVVAPLPFKAQAQVEVVVPGVPVYTAESVIGAPIQIAAALAETVTPVTVKVATSEVTTLQGATPEMITLY